MMSTGGVLISLTHVGPLSSQVDKPRDTWPVHRQTYSHLPSLTAHTCVFGGRRWPDKIHRENDENNWLECQKGRNSW